MNFVDEYGPAAYINRARKEGARDFGACMSPHTAFLVLQGMETLSLRMEKHIQNTRTIVNFLNAHKSVKSVCYPELSNHPDHDLANKILPKGSVTETSGWPEGDTTFSTQASGEAGTWTRCGVCSWVRFLLLRQLLRILLRPLLRPP